MPWLYLKGVSTGQFEEALAALLGPGAPGLSATPIGRLVSVWRGEHRRWQSRDLSPKRYVWADGVYFAPRLEHDRQCILVLIGADAGGRKELLAIEDGFRESEQSWHELLVRLRDENGLVADPRSSPPAMARSASGRRRGRSGRRPGSNGAGCTRRSTS